MSDVELAQLSQGGTTRRRPSSSPQAEDTRLAVICIRLSPACSAGVLSLTRRLLLFVNHRSNSAAGALSNMKGTTIWSRN